jgi:parallel beta-helix repeat protein
VKLTTRFLLIISLLLPFQQISNRIGLKQNAVTLTASQVTSAVDIEAAIRNVTAEGTRRGTVILDGREGAFLLSGADRSINIFVSNLVLRGVNGAVIQGCDDGLFFDDFPLTHITIREITFLCNGDGVNASGVFQDVALQHNLFQAGKNGIVVTGASSKWTITGNLILAGLDAVRLTAVEQFEITDNHISGNIAISLLMGTKNAVHDNAIQANYQGIQLGMETGHNTVKGNTILGVSAAGIALEPGVAGNRVSGNLVLCAFETSCLTVDAGSEATEMNTIAGNRP